MLRRYELTDQEWNQISRLFPPEYNGKRGRPRRDNRTMLNAVVWIARRAPRGEIFLNATVPGKAYTAVSRNGLMMASLIIFFAYSVWMPNCRKFHSTSPLSVPTSTAQASEKNAPPAEIGHSRGGLSTKIHAAVGAYGYPVYIMISEGQRNDINFAIPVLKHINIENSSVLADRGYDSNV